MHFPKIGRAGIAIIALLLGIFVGGFGPQLLRSKSTRNYPTSLEQVRLTSPDGQLDAVMIREGYGGALGGFEWYVYLVRKGRAASDGLTPVFTAYSLDGANLAWLQPHLLEIRYSKAGIEQFRNLWSLSETKNVGPAGERDYYVEVRLSPSSQFSMLTPTGKFR